MTSLNADVSTIDKMAAMMQSDETPLKILTSPAEFCDVTRWHHILLKSPENTLKTKNQRPTENQKNSKTDKLSMGLIFTFSLPGGWRFAPLSLVIYAT